MIILGIDPGIATVGFGAVETSGSNVAHLTHGVISTEAHLRLAYRLRRIYADSGELMDSLRPDAIAIEELFFNTNLKTAVAVAHGRAAVILAGEERGLPMYEYTPLQVKLTVAGYGRAEKKQVMEMVRRLLKLQSVPRPDDAADGLALALTHARNANSLLSGLSHNANETI
ncbi:MAG: crossover junction endodeoxyribonuclease RuvC [Oscillospiraceae bacterium]|nr:crossover junction endodeoxyribonuclease RuvC [Oscillospiraceae bacterium]